MKSEHVFLVFSIVILAVALYLVFTLQPACPASTGACEQPSDSAYAKLLDKFETLRVDYDLLNTRCNR